MPKQFKEDAMSDKNTTEENATPETSATLGEGGEKALKAERDARKSAENQNRELLAKLKEFEDRDKSESEKLSDAVKAAEDRATKAEAESLRLTVAFEKGLTPKQARRLVGSTKEELESDADDLLESFPSGDKDKQVEDNGRERPSEHLRPGSSTDPDGEDDSFDAEALASDIRGSNRI